MSKYKTKAGSIVKISGKYNGNISIDFDWFEENACEECEPEVSDDAKYLVWGCEYCEGGDAELTLYNGE